MTLAEFAAAARMFRWWPRCDPTPLVDRADIVLWPDGHTFARRALPSTSPEPFLDWYPLAGPGRSRVSYSDGERFYGSPML